MLDRTLFIGRQIVLMWTSHFIGSNGNAEIEDRPESPAQKSVEEEPKEEPPEEAAPEPEKEAEIKTPEPEPVPDAPGKYTN